MSKDCGEGEVRNGHTEKKKVMVCVGMGEKVRKNIERTLLEILSFWPCPMNADLEMAVSRRWRVLVSRTYWSLRQ